MRGSGSLSVSAGGHFLANVSRSWWIAHGLALTLIVALASSPAWARGQPRPPPQRPHGPRKDLLGENRFPPMPTTGSDSACAGEFSALWRPHQSLSRIYRSVGDGQACGGASEH